MTKVKRKLPAGLFNVTSQYYIIVLAVMEGEMPYLSVNEAVRFTEQVMAVSIRLTYLLL